MLQADAFDSTAAQRTAQTSSLGGAQTAQHQMSQGKGSASFVSVGEPQTA
jgi:hypothetical protein